MKCACITTCRRVISFFYFTWSSFPNLYKISCELCWGSAPKSSPWSPIISMHQRLPLSKSPAAAVKGIVEIPSQHSQTGIRLCGNETARTPFLVSFIVLLQCTCTCRCSWQTSTLGVSDNRLIQICWDGIVTLWPSERESTYIILYMQH